MTGKELAQLRKAAGFTQSQLAKQVQIGRHAVSYWECKDIVDLRSWAVTRMREVLDVPYFRTTTRTRVKGSYPLSWKEPLWAEAWQSAQKHRASQVRVICGAKTRMGTPCKAKSVKGKKRCNLHGGLSTGPRTQAGLARIAYAQRKRWKRDYLDPE
jgi:DNA-binding XRE family transcriptional regulator